MVYTADYLLNNYATNANVTSLVDNIEWTSMTEGAKKLGMKC